jgi:hypothetical protein
MATLTEIFDNVADDVMTSIGEYSAIFTPAIGDPVTLTVDMSTGIEYQPGSIEAQVSGNERIIEYVLDDIGREVNRDETFTIDSTVYTVQGIQENDGRFCKAVVTG